MKRLKLILSMALCLALPLITAPIVANGTTVSINAPAEVVVGSDFIARVDVSGVTNFDTCGFDVVYNPSVIHVTEVTDGTIGSTIVPVDMWGYIPAGSTDTGRVRVATNISGIVEGVSGNGYLAEIHFQVVGSAGQSSDITLEGVGMYDCYANPIVTTTQGATVTVKSAPVPDISVSPTSKNFGDVTVGSSSAAQTFTVSNVGTANLVIGTITITGTGADQFAKQNDNCSGQTIAPDSSATLQVVFSPTSTGAKSATLNIPSNDPDEATVTVPMSGNGVAAVTYYTLTVTSDPEAGGSVNLNPAQPEGGYESGTSVQLTAMPAEGYAFGSWSGDLTGSVNPGTIVMNSAKVVTAKFVLFIAPDTVSLTEAAPGVASITITPLDLASVDKSEMPPNITPQDAYTVNSTGTGSFTLRFINIANASNVTVYKIDSTGVWVVLPATVIDPVTVEVTMGVGDPPVVFGIPAGSVGGEAYPVSPWSTAGPWIGVGVGIIAIAAIATILARRRRT